jgi:hypothetical protein
MSIILALYDLGFNLLPCQPRTKEPAIRWQSVQSERLSRAEVERWIPRTTNWAMVHGPVGGTCAIDPEGLATIAWLNPHLDRVDTPVVRTGKSAPGDPRFHVYFKWQPGLPSFLRAEGINPIKVQRERCITILPGSIHPDTGRAYELRDGSFAQLASFPESLLAFSDAHKRTGGFSAPFELPPVDKITVGERRPLMNSQIATLRVPAVCEASHGTTRVGPQDRILLSTFLLRGAPAA